MAEREGFSTETAIFLFIINILTIFYYFLVY